MNPRLNQIYFLDVAVALDKRNSFAENRVDKKVIEKIETILRAQNRYVRTYKTMGKELAERRANNMEVENIIIGMTKESVIDILAAQQIRDWRPGRSDIAAILRVLNRCVMWTWYYIHIDQMMRIYEIVIMN